MGTPFTKLRRGTYDVQSNNLAVPPEKDQRSESVVSTSAHNIGSQTPPAMSSSDNVTEHVVCDSKELNDNEMKEFTIEGGRVLLVKENGQISALGAKCSHYGAPLAKGVLCNGIIRCPWHGACFDAKTGDIEDFPGSDSLAKYEVRVDSGKVKVMASKSQLQDGYRQKTMKKRDPANDSTYVIVGAGAAASSCVETLRQEGFTGIIVMITKEMYIPYDRVKLSKAMDSDIEKIKLRNDKFYSNYDIELIQGKEVTGIKPAKKTIEFDDKTQMQYDKIMLATGGIPRRVDTVGSNLENVVTLRSVDDANNIAKDVAGKHVIILGLSFIGMESAAFLVGKAKSVTVVGTPNLPFLPVVGEKIAIRLRKFFEDKGVKISDAMVIKEYIGENGKLKAVLLGDGNRIPADICLLGIGVSPGTNFVKGTEINLSPEGYVVVDKCMKSSVDDVYAAGDITKFPLFFTDNEVVNIQHWQMALAQGRIAGMNMAGKSKEIHSVPFFWTMFFGTGLRYTGYGFGYDDVVIHGNVEDMEFVAYYTKGDKVIAVASMKRDPIASQFAEILRTGKSLSKAEVSADATGWLKRLYA